MGIKKVQKKSEFAMKKVPFNQRFSLTTSSAIDDDFPYSARKALVAIIQDLINQSYVKQGTEDDWMGNWHPVITELKRTGRLETIEPSINDSVSDLALIYLKEMRWDQVYIFCERVYDRLLTAEGYFKDVGNIFPPSEKVWIETTSIEKVRQYYTDEINNILAEENLAFHFVNGEFQRRGRAQTQKSHEQVVGKVLGNPKLETVRIHYNKARSFFDQRPDPDAENCIKEALCALEACLETLSGESASKDFDKVVKKHEGNGSKQVPSPIAQGMIKLHGYRGSGQGVAHAATQGTKVTGLEAELVLSLTASYITYLVDLFHETEEEIPF